MTIRHPPSPLGDCFQFVALDALETPGPVAERIGPDGVRPAGGWSLRWPQRIPCSGCAGLSDPQRSTAVRDGFNGIIGLGDFEAVLLNVEGENGELRSGQRSYPDKNGLLVTNRCQKSID